MTAAAAMFQKARVVSLDLNNGIVTCTLLSGPTVTVPFLGSPPELYNICWLAEVAPGSFLCMGSPGEGPSCGIKIFLGSPDNITTATDQALDWDSYDWFKNWWDTSLPIGPYIFPGNDLGALTFPLTGNPHGLQVPYTGLYLIDAQIQYAANATGARLVLIKTGGGTVLKVGSAPGVATAGHSYAQATTVQLLTQGTAVDAQAWQNSGGTLATGSGVNSTYLSLTLLSTGTKDLNNELLTPGVGYR